MTPRHIGHQRAIAFLLSLGWPDGVVSRLTVGAANPQRNALGEPVPPARASAQTRRTLQRYERVGWLQRGKVFVRATDPAALRARAFGGLDFEPVLPHDFLDVPRTVRIIREALAFERNSGIRRLIRAEAELLEKLAA
jgi:hypothetical protein